VAHKMVPDIQWLLDRGLAVPAAIGEALEHRLKLMLDCTALCLDHYRVDVEGRGVYRAVGPQLGCAQCGALESQEGDLLAPCTACGVAFYCSECQWLEWQLSCLFSNREGGGS
jgi:hypothetical protein